MTRRRRLAAIPLLICFLAFGSGALARLHDLHHEDEDAAQSAEAEAVGLRLGWPSLPSALGAVALAAWMLVWSKRRGANDWLLPSLYVGGLSPSPRGSSSEPHGSVGVPQLSRDTGIVLDSSHGREPRDSKNPGTPITTPGTFVHAGRGHERRGAIATLKSSRVSTVRLPHWRRHRRTL